jgi:hypothetical protein
MRTAGRPGKPTDRYIDDYIWSPIVSMAADPKFSRPKNAAEVIAFQYEIFEIIDGMLSMFYLPGNSPKAEDINSLHMDLIQWRDRQPAELDPVPFAVPNVFHLRSVPLLA